MTGNVGRTGPDDLIGVSSGVILGFDAGWDDPRPLRVAADEAHLRREPLFIVTVSRPDLNVAVPRARTGWDALGPTWSETETRRSLRAAGRAARARHDDLPVSTAYLTLDDMSRFGRSATGASLLVLGGADRFGGHLHESDSTSHLLMEAACCPTMIVPTRRTGNRARQPVREPEIDDRGPVLAAVPGGRRGVEVIRHAEEERQRRGRSLHLLHAFDLMPGERRSHAMRRASDQMMSSIEQAGLDAGAPWSVTLAREPAGAAIRERAAQAGLVVLGNRAGTMNDLVGDLLDRLMCPVLLLPADHHPAGPLIGHETRRGRRS
ncbi:universal stress protein [Kineosporia sp. NBRC 101731]|uniref:universal stress protein n=1 Tax=Kineosporia sp. NBRC 101731 TaxID=3032199 RepID=UPI0024A57839|nr:universal stress protein [Kineosporia sp. NBRC 101731]GLY28831.1 hypothetical protein Kisp02_21960 [Kineosporia sp. NBRC 101731]